METTIVLCAAALIVGLSKGGLASTAAIAVPLLALFMNPIQAAALLLPVYIVTDWVAVALYRRNFSKRNLAILLPSILCGVGIATLLTPYTPESVLLIVTGLIGLVYCLRNGLERGREARRPAALWPGIFWGTIAGITSFITHSGGPPAQVYLLPQRLPKLDFAGTLALVFAAANLAKLPAYWELGKLRALDVPLMGGMIATGIVGTGIGRWVAKRLSEAVYRRLVETLLFALSLILLGKGAWIVLSGN